MNVPPDREYGVKSDENKPSGANEDLATCKLVDRTTDQSASINAITFVSRFDEKEDEKLPATTKRQVTNKERQEVLSSSEIGTSKDMKRSAPLPTNTIDSIGDDDSNKRGKQKSSLSPKHDKSFDIDDITNVASSDNSSMSPPIVKKEKINWKKPVVSVYRLPPDQYQFDFTISNVH
jgi:hypothetical protein